MVSGAAGNNIPIWEKMNLTIEEAAAYSNIGIGRIRQLVRDPKCPFVLKVGSKYLVKRALFETYVMKSDQI